MNFLIGIGKFIVSNLDTVKVILGLLGASISTGIGVAIQKKIENKKNTEVKEIVSKNSRNTKELEKITEHNKKNGLTKFIINNIMLIGICVFIYYLFNQILANPLFSKDIEFLKDITMVKIVFFLFIATLIATRIASSTTSFDSIIKSLPIIKKFIK